MLVVLGAVAVAGCASMTVGSHVERAADIQRYHTFAWGPPDALPTGDPRLDGNVFYRDHVLGAVEKQLLSRGFLHADTPDPDLRLHFHANVRHRIDVGASDRQYGYSSGELPPAVVEFEQGTLVVDVIDARTNRLIWRGWAQDSVRAEDAERVHRQIDEGVTRMFRTFPFVAATP